MSPMHAHLEKMFKIIKKRFKSDFDDYAAFNNLFRLQRLEESEHWVRAGEHCGEFFFLSEGLVRIYFVDHEGSEVNEGFYDEGSLLGPISCFANGEACQYNIQALEPCNLLVANYKAFHNYARQSVDTLEFEINFLQELFLSTAKRDNKRLINNGEQRYRWFCREYPHLLERLPQYHIASFLGMTPVSLSRLRKQMEKS